MKQYRFGRKLLAPVAGILALYLGSPPLLAQMDYRQQNLVSDIPGMAQHTDANLVNPWGIASSPTSPLWVADNGTGVATVYNSHGTALPLVVTVPSPSGGTSAPTGQVFNGTANFNGDRFLFSSEDGTITGWRGSLGTTAETLSDMSGAGAVYKGLALATIGTNTYLYATDFANNRVDVLPGTGAPALTGTFSDPTLPANYSPFNIQTIGTSLYVTFAQTQQGSDDEAHGAGFGYVDKFDLNGNFQMRVASQGVLNAPWGLTIAPASFGKFGGDLLVGNFGDGMINVFDPTSGDLLGQLKDSQGNPLVISGLWGLRFGNGGNGGAANALFFTAGIADEGHGLFGRITPVPEPATTGAIGAIGLLAFCAAVRARRRKAIVDPIATA